MIRFLIIQEPQFIVLLSYSRWEDGKSTAGANFFQGMRVQKVCCFFTIIRTVGRPEKRAPPVGYSEGAMRLGPVARKIIDPCA